MKTKRLSFVVLASALALGTPAVAQETDPEVESEAAPAEEAPPPAEPPPPADVPAPPMALTPGADAVFGAAGQIAISDDLQMFVKRISTEGQPGNLTDIQLRPAVDYFAVANLSLGAQLIIGYQSLENNFGSDNSSVQLGLQARVGYNFPISSITSIWPRVSLGYLHVGGTLNGNPNSSASYVPLQVYVPLVFQPAPHFFVGGGPMVESTLYGKQDGIDIPDTSSIGIRSTVGGHFKGM